MTKLEQRAEVIIGDLMDVIEKQLPDYYYSSNEIMHANDWLRDYEQFVS